MCTVPWSLATQINDESLLKLILQQTTSRTSVTGSLCKLPSVAFLPQLQLTDIEEFYYSADILSMDGAMDKAMVARIQSGESV